MSNIYKRRAEAALIGRITVIQINARYLIVQHVCYPKLQIITIAGISAVARLLAELKEPFAGLRRCGLWRHHVVLVRFWSIILNPLHPFTDNSGILPWLL